MTAMPRRMQAKLGISCGSQTHIVKAIHLSSARCIEIANRSLQLTWERAVPAET